MARRKGIKLARRKRIERARRYARLLQGAGKGRRCAALAYLPMDS